MMTKKELLKILEHLDDEGTVSVAVFTEYSAIVYPITAWGVENDLSGVQLRVDIKEKNKALH